MGGKFIRILQGVAGRDSHIYVINPFFLPEGVQKILKLQPHAVGDEAEKRSQLLYKMLYLILKKEDRWALNI